MVLRTSQAFEGLGFESLPANVNLAHQPDSQARAALSLKESEPPRREPQRDTQKSGTEGISAARLLYSPLLEKDRSEVWTGSDATEAAEDTTW